MEVNSSTRNHVLAIFRRQPGWLSTSFIATILHSETGCKASLAQDVVQLEAFLVDLPEIEGGSGQYRLKLAA
jgi:hypothetical protein